MSPAHPRIYGRFLLIDPGLVAIRLDPLYRVAGMPLAMLQKTLALNLNVPEKELLGCSYWGDANG